MATDIKMPQMGESIAEGTLTRWFKQPGESVKRDEPLFEISTDKVDAEIPSPGDGVLEKILVEEGTTVEVNTIVAVLGDGSGAAATPEPAAAPPAAEEKPAPTPPPAAPAPAPVPAAPAPAVATSASSAGATDDRSVRTSPLVRRIAREHGITNLSRIPGTGLGGRVTKHDILSFIETAPDGGAAPAAAPALGHAQGVPAVHAEALPVLGLPRDNAKVERMSVMRKKIAEHMIDSRRTSAHVHSVFEADMTNIVKLRNRHKKAFEERHGTKLAFTAFFVKAVTNALLEFPHINASLDGEDILLHNSVNMGIAVALDGGLIVPVIRDAHELNLVGLQKRITDLAGRARNKKLQPDEVQGGTFTITNPGQFGGLFGIPIINQPQVAILGLGGIVKRPVVVEGDAIAVRDMVYMCLSYDHRLVDGALADHFMARLKQMLENWDGSVLD